MVWDWELVTHNGMGLGTHYSKWYGTGELITHNGMGLGYSLLIMVWDWELIRNSTSLLIMVWDWELITHNGMGLGTHYT